MSSERYERGSRMLTAVDGPAGLAVVEGLAKSFPDFARYVLEFPFGDIYARNGLGLRERELATVAALCALGHALSSRPYPAARAEAEADKPLQRRAGGPAQLPTSLRL